MPRYEYACKTCGSVMEVEHSITEQPRVVLYCPTCATMREVEKLISSSTFRLSWVHTTHPGKRTPLKCINGHYYDKDSYAAAKARGVVK